MEPGTAGTDRAVNEQGIVTPAAISDAHLKQLSRASRRAAILSLLGFLLVIGAFGYAALKLSGLEHDLGQLRVERGQLVESITNLRSRTQDLLRTQEGVLDFLGGVTASEQIRLIDPSVDWTQTKRYLLEMDAGPRKRAVLAAILLAWKDLPFSIKNKSLSSGLDSPHFINVALSSVGVRVQQKPDLRLSDAMMQQFKRVATPLPGDLIFYRGNLGNFVVMYIAPGSPNGNGIAVGTLQTGEEVQVLDTANVNTPMYPFIGFFRVPYPSEAAP